MEAIGDWDHGIKIGFSMVNVESEVLLESDLKQDIGDALWNIFIRYGH
jgi:hypothetical protein